MKQFMDKDFLLESEAARILYHEHAAKMPIIDYHCHINPQEIFEDKRYESITEVWLGGDHYKWRAMRCNGIPESEITGAIKNDPYKVFESWAKTLPRAVGNPLYHWTYLELKKYFGITEELNEKSCKDIYDRCNAKLKEDNMSVRGLIDQSDVKLICTTDDPIDDLNWHEKIAADKTCKVKVLPAFRPDKAMNVDKAGFPEYIEKLEKVSGVEINSFAALKKALFARIDYFNEHGCKVSDHALDYTVCSLADEKELDAILAEAKKGVVSLDKADKFKTAVLLAVSEKYHEYNWVMQIHYGCLRNNSTRLFEKLGPDTGFDSVNDAGGAAALAGLLDAMQKDGHLPKMVLYSLNESDNEVIATIAGCFQTDGECPSKIQLGSAWWFNDNRTGMTKQLTDLANLGVLGNFIGMLTDSRSFLSYTRHEYFRRILCNLIGSWVEKGEIQPNMDTLGAIVEDICYNNTVRFFGFDI